MKGVSIAFFEDSAFRDIVTAAAEGKRVSEVEEIPLSSQPSQADQPMSMSLPSVRRSKSLNKPLPNTPTVPYPPCISSPSLDSDGLVQIPQLLTSTLKKELAISNNVSLYLSLALGPGVRVFFVTASNNLDLAQLREYLRKL